MLDDDYRQPDGACCPVRNVLRWLALPLSSDISETLETGYKPRPAWRSCFLSAKA